MTKKKIARTNEVKEGEAVKFVFTKGAGKPTEGFLARFRGELVAYQNVCRHLPFSLDFGEGEFFTPDGQNFVCHSHNALYDPLTGLCVRGPCEGLSLKPLKIEIIAEEVWLIY